MPLYEYRCKKCEHRFERMRRLADRDKRTACPECKSRATDRVTIQTFAVVSGTAPDAFGGDGESEDFGDFGDFGDEHGHDHGHDHGLDMGMDDFDF